MKWLKWLKRNSPWVTRWTHEWEMAKLRIERDEFEKRLVNEIAGRNTMLKELREQYEAKLVRNAAILDQELVRLTRLRVARDAKRQMYRCAVEVDDISAFASTGAQCDRKQIIARRIAAMVEARMLQELRHL